ncbi:MAG TPA: hypothetical protein VJP45_03535 [Candidatus Limnocylindria bacterium]|nr:hypothetical protein [Candidatus Limnocylindria bacterium]
MGVKLIAYECVAPEHQPSLLHPDKLTIHDGHWAFCAFDARAEGHRWSETGGEQMEVLLTRSGLVGGVSAHEPRTGAKALVG